MTLLIRYLSVLDRAQRRSVAKPGAFLAGLLLIAIGLGLSPLSTFGQQAETTVTASVRIASSCLIVSPTAVDFGTLELTQPTAARSAVAQPTEATATVSLRNCSSQNETILVRGGPATGAGVLWSHAPPGADVCIGPNLFIQGVRDAARSEKRLTIIDQAFKTMPAGASEPVTLTLTPPCSGSTGAGQTLTVKYIFVATLAEQVSR
jgi:hypothetical protein